MFETPFDVNFLLQNGYHETSIAPFFADLLLAEVKKEKFQEDIPDEPDYVGYVEKYYRDRFISSDDRNNQEDRSPLKALIANALIDYQRPLIRYYTGGSKLENSNITAYEGRPGYTMAWHQDIGDRSITESIIYLNEQPWVPEHGGEIELAEVTRDSEGRVLKRDTIAIVPPVHGKIVTLENLSPHFEHRVLPWNGPHSRFSVIIIAGMLHSY